MSIAQKDIEAVQVDWRKVEMDIRSEQAKMARAIGSSLASFVVGVFKAPAALLGGRAATKLQA